MFRMRFGNKYGAKKQEFNGVSYHSKKEAGYASELELRKKAGDIKDWSRQKVMPLDVGRFHICNYVIDFVIEHNDESIEYVEVKGFETALWRLKWKLFEATYGDLPNVRLTVVK